jgi:TPR repeat protein
MIVIMDRPWFRKLFRRPRKDPLADTQMKAEHGDAEAQFRLGLKCYRGEGTAPDYAQAAQWYLKAANQDHALAQLTLGIMFADGRGVRRDEAAAMMWIRRAAQKGHAGAQHNLGLRCQRARFDGPPQDARESGLEAYKWLRLAAAQGHAGSGAACEGIALGMTREQVIEANQRVTAFIAAGSKPVPV